MTSALEHHLCTADLAMALPGPARVGQGVNSIAIGQTIPTPRRHPERRRQVTASAR